MKSVGTKVKKSSAMIADSGPTIRYPSMTVSTKAMPKLKNARLNQKGTMLVTYKVKGMNPDWDDKNEHRIDMDIEKAEIRGSGWKKHIEKK